MHRDRFLQRPAGGGDDGRRLLLTAGSLEEGAAKPLADPGRERRQRERRQTGAWCSGAWLRWPGCCWCCSRCWRWTFPPARRAFPGRSC
ncbi:hypothetical protein D8B23_20610 [Verminephrobacter aporrectodeae subsp. tuberculatae]|nr:hypothetical protein [Verminephrobacter aporrectodeae subsp. tuberculatae]